MPSDVDFAVKTFPRRIESPDQLEIKVKDLDLLWNEVLRKINAYEDDQPLEPLDVVTSALVFSADSQQLTFKCDLIYPTASFNFIPISPLKIVSSPLSLKLAKRSTKAAKFQTGFLTLDLNQRLLPLLLSDPLAQKYPLVGIWVTNIPRSSQSSPSSFMHPLVWSACVRFVQTSSVKEKISPDPEQYSFLCVHFSTKPKFFEVSASEEIVWKVASCSSQVNRQEGGYFSPAFINFLKEEEDSCSSDNTMNFTYTLPVQTRPLRDSKESTYKENATDTRPDEFMKQQMRTMMMLQQQVEELQSQIMAGPLSRASSRNAAPQPTLKRTSTCTNTTISKKELVSTATNTSFIVEPKVPYNPTRYSSTRSDFSIYKDTQGSHKSQRATSMQDTSVNSSVSDYLGFDIDISRTFKPNELYSVRKTDQTLSVPKIIFEPVCESSDEDESLQMVQRKYLR
jgi:hypothetical protein